MLIDILDMFYSCIDSVIDAINNTYIFEVGNRGITLWHFMLGLFICSLIFGFFLVPRGGSVADSVSNFDSARERGKSEVARSKAAEARSKAAEARNSYEAYKERRSRNEAYAKQYNHERRQGK